MLHSPTPDRPSLNPLPDPNIPSQTHDTTEKHLDTDSDIYRGQLPSPRSPYSESVAASSSSSSSWSFFIGRLGAFTNIVSTLEQAIHGWRGNSSDASSQSSAASRSQLSRRRKRRGSASNLRSQQSERDFSARISLIKARGESRIIPRQFSLYLAPSLRPVGAALPKQLGEVDSPYSQGVLWTSSLDSVLNQLDAALKKTTRTRRNRERDVSPSRHSPDALGGPHHHFMLPEDLKAPSRAASFTDLTALRKAKKGKAKDFAEAASDITKSIQAHNPWFLDVASPTSEDMRAIGKLLHLHPLTLEDILQQDPREKLERFPKLGYYFVSFRAIESRTIRAKLERQVAGTSGDEALLVESNVYLVVFNEGVCSFHFMDASEHIDRVRSRIISLERSINLSSAWIAHSLLDSIVDSFFPFSDEIEKEVMAIEKLVYSDNNDLGDTPIKLDSLPLPSPQTEKEDLPTFNEKIGVKLAITHTRFTVSRPPLHFLYRRFLRSIRTRWRSSLPTEKVVAPPSSKTITLRRMAATRRLVTSIARLLSTKGEVVTQIRKRLLSGSGNTKASNEEVEVAMYMGDVQDHILALQHHMSYYEQSLARAHPIYLQQLGANTAQAKSGSDKALVYLTVVSMAVVVCQTINGVFSLNVTLPMSTNFDIFGIIIAVECMALLAFLGLVRRWWINAKRHRGNVLG